MQIKLEKVYPVKAPSSLGWTILSDIPAVASCMPGAEITEQIDDTHYKGQAKVKVGPATVAFRGDIDVKGLDPESRELRMIAKGSDTKGNSSATMDLTATIRDAGDSESELVGIADVKVTGKIVSMGGRMMNAVANQVLNQFGENFANQVLALGEGEAAATAAQKAAGQPKEINGLAFVWQVIIQFFRNLFRGKHKATG
jgi:carbon monoxide dehydrogenase subunit G